jgi:hypothetical protein
MNTWNDLTKLTRGEPFDVERVRLKQSGIAIEGVFELPTLVQMSEEDQVFVAAFLRSHGSIKDMERLFGISYPTVKARLARIAEQLPFVEVVEAAASEPRNAALSTKEILDRLEKGKIDATEAAELLRKKGER